MSNVTVELEGLDKVMKKLYRVKAQEAVIAGFSWGMDRVQKELMEYPPETFRNRPHQVVDKSGKLGALKWYERDKGSHVRDKLYRTTEKLKKKWKQKLTHTPGNITGTLSNTASYAGYVHGDRKVDGEGQTDLMKEIGWEIGGDVAKKFKSKIEKIILDNFKKKWR